MTVQARLVLTIPVTSVSDVFEGGRLYSLTEMQVDNSVLEKEGIKWRMCAKALIKYKDKEKEKKILRAGG